MPIKDEYFCSDQLRKQEFLKLKTSLKPKQKSFQFNWKYSQWPEEKKLFGNEIRNNHSADFSFQNSKELCTELKTSSPANTFDCLTF